MSTSHQLSLVVILVAVGFVPLDAPSDTIELVNGDKLHGKVLSLDDKQVKLTSEILGELSLAREKVVAIFLDQQQPSAGKDAKSATNGGSTVDGVGRFLESHGADAKNSEAVLHRLGLSAAPTDRSQQSGATTAQDVVKRLQTQGVDPATMKQLETNLPLLGVPGVRDYFNEKLSGLISGTLNIQDLRNDARKARDGLLDIKKDLGPDGAALDGYLRILEKFIQETESSRPSAEPPK